MSDILAVNEIFGPTIQGEGPHMGKPCLFLRLAGCNLACSWCDTPYTWDWSRYNSADEISPMDMMEVLDRLLAMSVAGRSGPDIRHLVVSGGEPMLQQRVLAKLLRELHRRSWFTEIETAGTIVPQTTELARHYNVSPKLRTSGNPLERRYKPAALDAFALAPSRAFKFVVSESADFNEIDMLVAAHHLHPVYIMPEGVSYDVIAGRLPDLATACIDRGYRLTTRLHIEIYGNKRGV